KDERAGILSALLAVGVAFCPTTPEGSATTLLGVLHYIFAAVLFSTLAYFCLVLFKTTVKDKRPTPKKLKRNRVYSICGCVIIASIVFIGASKLFNISHLVGSIGPVFFFETTALLSFGIAWLTKGETFLKDEETPLESRATNNLTMTFH